MDIIRTSDIKFCSHRTECYVEMVDYNTSKIGIPLFGKFSGFFVLVVEQPGLLETFSATSERVEAFHFHSAGEAKYE